MADESLRFDIIGKDNASGAFSRVGASVKDMGDRMNIATRSALVLDEALKKQQTAARSSADATLAAAKADKILADAEHVLRDGALEAEFALKKEAEAAKKSGDAAVEAAAKNRAFADSLRNVADKAKGSGGPGWLGPALLGLPAVASLAGVTAGAAIGLGGAFATAGVALGAFGVVAKSVLGTSATAAKAVTTAQDTYTIAIANGAKKATAYRAEQIAIAKAYNDLSPAQIRLSKELSGISDQWKNFRTSVTPLIAGSLQPWLHGVGLGMSNLRTLITPMAPVVHSLGVEFGILMGSSTFKSFIAWTGTTGAAVTKSAGGAVMDLITGMTFLLPQFTPLIKGASDGILKWGDAFVRWSSSQKAASQIHDFLAWFHDNGPLVGQLLRNVGGALKALAPGLGTGATTELQLVSDFFGFIAKLPPGLAKPLLDVAGVLLTLNKLGVVSAGVKLAFPAKDAGRGALAASLGMKLIGGALILPASVMIIGSFIPKDTSKQAATDFKNQPGIVIKVSDFLHTQGMGAWIDQYFSHPIRAWAEDSLPHFLGVAGTKIADFFTRTVPHVLALFRDKAHLIWDQVEIDVLQMVFKISGYMGRLPGPLGAPFRAAHKSIGTELAGIQADAAKTARQINADWNTLHGKKVALTFGLNLPAGVSFPSRPIKGRGAKGIKGAAAGTWLVGEEGPELAYLPQGTHVLPAGPTRKIMGGLAGGTVGDFTGNFPSAATIGGAASAMQQAVGTIAALVKGILHIDKSAFNFAGPTGGSTGPGAAAAQAWMRAHLGDYTWGASQWAPLVALWNHESGWRWNAQNPTSPAYGIPQADPGSKMAVAGADWRTNPVTQMRWGAEYIRGTYGNPANAWAFEMSHTPNWYDHGGYLPTGLSMAYNGTGRPEPVGRGGGNTYNITVHVPPSANQAEIGRHLVTAIGAFEKRSGKGWRK